MYRNWNTIRVRLCIWSGALLTLAAPGFRSQMAAEEYAVRHIKYANRGNYVAQFTIRWNENNGEMCEVELGELGENDVKDIDLSNQAGFKFISDNKESCRLDTGDEVWGVVNIYFGDRKSCRKSAQFRYHKEAGTLRYRSDGTAWNGNRCEIREKPGTAWPLGTH